MSIRYRNQTDRFFVNAMADGSFRVTPHREAPTDRNVLEKDYRQLQSIISAVAAIDVEATMRSSEHRFRETRQISFPERNNLVRIRFLDSINESEELDYSFQLLSSAKVNINLRTRDIAPLNGKRLHYFLKGVGFQSLGKVKINSRAVGFWSQYPQMFCDRHGNLITDRVRDYLSSKY